MSEAPIDPEHNLRRVMYALIHDGGTPVTDVLIAEDDESMGQALALQIVAATSPELVGNHIYEIRDALMARRWADALAAWMDATGRVVDVYPDEEVRSSKATNETIELELLLKPIFSDLED